MLQVHAQLFVAILPCEVYDEFDVGRLEQLWQDPELVPEQLLRYLPTAQLWAQLLHAKPFPSSWLHDPVRYLFAPHEELLQALHVLPSL